MSEMISRGSKLIENAKDSYIKKIGMTLARPETGTKTYWSLINNILNKAKVPTVPPPLENDIFILDFTGRLKFAVF